jgi:hypothetical protein
VNETGAPGPFVRPPRIEDVGIWWREEMADDEVVNFAARFLSREAMRALEDERGWYQAGPVRLEAIVELDVAGARVSAARRDYRRQPELREIRFELGPTRITLLGWSVSFQELEGHARGLERLELRTPLFRAMEVAQARSDARFQEFHPDPADPDDR